MEKLVSLIQPLEINISDMMGKLVSQIKYEKKGKDNLVWKDGDLGDKFYIVLNGSSSSLAPSDREVEYTQLKYMKYLILLYIYQGYNLLLKTIFTNREKVKISGR